MAVERQLFRALLALWLGLLDSDPLFARALVWVSLSPASSLPGAWKAGTLHSPFAVLRSSLKSMYEVAGDGPSLMFLGLGRTNGG